MAYREVEVVEIREMLRRWASGQGYRRIADQAGVDRKTVRRYVEAAQRAGLTRGAGEGHMDDSLVGQVLDAVQGRATAERGAAWRTCEAQRDSTAKVTFDRALLEELATLRFIDAHQRVLILGPVGVGKTFLAHALGHIACRRGYSVQLSSTEKLLKRLKAGRLDQSHEEELRRLITVDLLILDDFAMGPLDALETHDVFDIIAERHQKHSLVVTSNRDTAEWMLLMADPLRAQACLDRLVNSAYDLVIEGESYRERLKPTRRAAAG